MLLLGAALAAAGCGLGPGSKVGSVDLTVTRDFGATKLTEVSGEANESDTVLRFLEREAEIETRYGGGYVKSIDGVSESERGGHPYDWFFFVDGVLSPTGAAEVQLEGGAKIWWDLHNWSATEGSPAVVGSWPAPFTTGWEGHAPVVAVECAGGGEACGTVEKALEGEGVEVSPPHAVVSGQAIRVFVGPWSQIRHEPAAALLEKGPGESGIYAEFEASSAGERLVGLDEDGEKARTFGTNAGLVAATRHFEGPPVWLVTGATDAGVQAAATAVDTVDLRGHFAVASEAGAVTPLPLRSGSR
ncbi:MAG TPA: DUF4430 domain-containing protein [Solirubrobacterales bacterium]|nr:DUF4430 domain-containing protein [Solirubrobacterales bacterium]